MVAKRNPVKTRAKARGNDCKQKQKYKYLFPLNAYDLEAF